ncbi:hypothetical protein BH09ACT5_BH09ACT5_15980 [soil metagenome]
MDSRWARVARGAAAAAVATFVAAFSHWLAGGVAPSLFGVGVSLLISVMACTMLTGRTLSTWRLAVGVGLSQALFHGLFSGLGTPVLVEHSMTAMDAPLPHLHAAPTMWLAHLAAALVTVAALRFGERAFWGVIRTARLLLTRLLVIVVPVLRVPRPVVVVRQRFLPRDLALLLSSMRHRGPPAELLAA